MKKAFVGSRGSRLALIQAESVLAKMKELRPDVEFSLVRIRTKGDRLWDVPLHQLPSVGAFVRELEESLLDRRIDMAVHSLKDLPTEIPQGLSLAAVVARVDPRDVLVSRGEKLSQLAPGSRIGTGSLRRAAQLLQCRPDLKVETVRGNVDTRIRKVADGELDGVILAAAGMIRLGKGEMITQYLPVEDFLPAVGQGALGIEIRSDDSEMAELASALNHQPTWCSVIAERAFLRALGGGCRAPIAALGRVDGNTLRLEGMVAGAEGKPFLRSLEEGSAASPEQVGTQLAQRMWEMGASQLIAETRA